MAGEGPDAISAMLCEATGLGAEAVTETGAGALVGHVAGVGAGVGDGAGAKAWAAAGF